MYTSFPFLVLLHFQEFYYKGKSGERRHPSLALDLRRKRLYFVTITYDVSCGVFTDFLYLVKKLLYYQCVLSFYHD